MRGRLACLLILTVIFGPNLQAQQPSEFRGKEKTLVVVFRPGRWIGRTTTPSVYIDGVEVARIDNKRYFSIYLPRKTYTFAIDRWRGARPSQNVKVGKEPLYLKVRFYKSYTVLELVDQKAALTEIKKTKIKPLDSKWVRHKDIVFDLTDPGATDPDEDDSRTP
jgi:hypothetical protein